MSQGAAYDLQDVTVAFDGQAALRGVSLAIAPGEAVALVGPSGAGKSTLLRLLNGSVRPGTGSVQVDGVSLQDLAPKALRGLRSRTGFVHQDRQLVPNLRVLQNVLLGRVGRMGFWGTLRTLLRPRRDDVRSAFALLERVGIPEKLFARTDTLSGGQQQRVAIARALHQDPSALLADEPVSSVDPARAQDTVDLLTRISREDGRTLIMSLHDLPLAKAWFPRLIGLRGGRVVFDAAPDAIGEDAFQALYDLEADEVLADGA